MDLGSLGMLLGGLGLFLLSLGLFWWVSLYAKAKGLEEEKKK